MVQVVAVAKVLGVFFIKKMLLNLVLDLVQENLEKGASKTECKWDDNLALEFKKNRTEIELLIKGVL